MALFHPKTIEYLSVMNSYTDFFVLLENDITKKGITINQYLVGNNLDKSNFYKAKKGKKIPSLITLDKYARLI